MAIIHNGDFIFHVDCTYYAMASFYLLPCGHLPKLVVIFNGLYAHVPRQNKCT